MNKTFALLALLPASALADTHRCDFLPNEDKIQGALIATRNEDDRTYTVVAEHQPSGRQVTVADAAETIETDRAEAIAALYDFYAAAHHDAPPVAQSEVKRAQGIRFKRDRHHVSFGMLLDAEGTVLGRVVIAEAVPYGCKP